MTFFTTPELLEIGDIPMTALGEKPTRAEALKYYRRVAEHYGLDIHQYERVDRHRRRGRRFQVHTTDRHGLPAHLSRRARSCSPPGYYDLPNLLNVPGEDLPKVIHYYKEPHPYYDQDVAVVGGEELGGDRRAGAVLDGRARHAGPSRRRRSRPA